MMAGIQAKGPRRALAHLSGDGFRLRRGSKNKELARSAGTTGEVLSDDLQRDCAVAGREAEMEMEDGGREGEKARSGCIGC